MNPHSRPVLLVVHLKSHAVIFTHFLLPTETAEMKEVPPTQAHCWKGYYVSVRTAVLYMACHTYTSNLHCHFPHIFYCNYPKHNHTNCNLILHSRPSWRRLHALLIQWMQLHPSLMYHSDKIAFVTLCSTQGQAGRAGLHLLLQLHPSLTKRHSCTLIMKCEATCPLPHTSKTQ